MRSIMIGVALALLSIQMVQPASAQAPNLKPPPPMRGPQVMIQEGDNSRPLALQQADIDVAITGYLSQTTMVLTFRNDTNRLLEGELDFPLPENATVSGYGLDVNGTIVDGVVVEKLKARLAYEQETRRRIDPGLVEKTQGNNFRTRVYPIPAQGTRTIKVQYVCDLSDTPAGPLYLLPLNWGQKVERLHMRLTINKADGIPVAKGLRDLGFKEWQDQYIAEATLQDADLDSDLSIQLPPASTQKVWVEQRVRQTQALDDLIEGTKLDPTPEYYFVVSDKPSGSPPGCPQAAKVLQHVGILWDASLVRAQSDKKNELAAMKAVLAPMKNGQVDVVVFRNEPDQAVEFEIKNGNVDKLVEFLQNVAYDGATNLGLLQAPAKNAKGPYNFWLLFSDGLSTIGPALPQRLESPVYAVSDDARANHAVLRQLATQSGGIYFNLQRVSASEMANAVLRPPQCLLGVDYDPAEVADVYPRGAQPVMGRVMVCGRLLAPQAKITLKYSWHQTQCMLSRDKAASTGLVGRFWAQQKVADLDADAETNAAEITATAREFNLVTTNTSLLVLENVQQYIQYRIVPPASRPEIYQQFMAQAGQMITERKQVREHNIEQIVNLWNNRVKWWEAKYEIPKDGKLTELPVGPVNRVGGPLQEDIAGQITGATQPAQEQLRSIDGIVNTPPSSGVPATPADGNSDQSRSDSHAAGGPAAAPAPALTPAAARPTEGEQTARPLRDLVVGRNPVPASPQGRQDLDSEQIDNDGAITINGSGRSAESRVFGYDIAGKKGDVESDRKSLAPAIAIKPWDPRTPYLAAMKVVGPDKAYAVYLEMRKEFAASPAFYLDCGDFLLQSGQHDLGVRVLSNIAALKLDSAPLLRVAAHRLEQTAVAADRELAIDLFQRVLKIRPEEPQSYRDLALALADRAGDEGRDTQHKTADLQRALDLLNQVVIGQWDNRFPEIQLPVLMEANQLIAKAQHLDLAVTNPLDKRLSKLLDLDLRVVMTWDADATDVDLWVTEPSGEKCIYNHNRTRMGGLLSADFQQGYGPEEYCLRSAAPGTYKIQANFFGSRQITLSGPVTVQATVITHFGRPDEQRRSLTIRLTTPKDTVDLGTVNMGSAAAN